MMPEVSETATDAVDCPSARVVSDLGELLDAGERFRTIYADPPWQYANGGTRGAARRHYRTMPLEEIVALPVADLAEENAHLHLWTTNGFLPDALGLLAHWGFEYKSMLVWVKPQMGLGNYWRVSHELLLFGLRGRLPFQDRAQRSWLLEDRTRHSAKPESVRERIEKVSPGPRLELFGRRAVPGWTVWGDQVEVDLLSLTA